MHDIHLVIVTSVPFFLVTQLRHQLEYLRDHGFDITVISASGEELPQINWGARLRHVVVDISRRPSPWRDLKALISLIRIFQAGNFAVSHSTTPKAGLLTAIAAWMVRIPIRLHTFTGQQWLTVKGLFRIVLRMADCLITRLNVQCYADSDSQREFLIHEHIANPEKLSVLGHGSLAGVNMTRFDSSRYTHEIKFGLRTDLGIAGNDPIAIFIGRIAVDKGVRELLDAHAQVRAAGYPLHLLLVGPLDDERGGSRGIARSDLVGTEGVHYLGFHPEPERYMAISDFLCLPSYREGFGTVVIEAAAMGIPTLGTRINGLIDAIEDGTTGMLVPPKDAGALAGAMLSLLGSDTLMKKMGSAARERCIRNFDADVVNKRLVQEYRRLLVESGVTGFDA